MTAEDRLERWLADTAPPARDLAFEAAVAERIARRRAWATAGALTPWAVAAGAALWGLQPVAADLGRSLGPAMGQALAPAGAMLVLGAVTAATALGAARRFGRR